MECGWKECDKDIKITQEKKNGKRMKTYSTLNVYELFH
jgi:hypothetical protein